MAVVWMHIDKFKGVVKINDDHPLAVAQRQRDAEKASKPKAIAPRTLAEGEMLVDASGDQGVRVVEESPPPKPKRRKKDSAE